MNAPHRLSPLRIVSEPYEHRTARGDRKHGDVSWITAITDYEDYLRAAGRPDTTRALRTYQVRRFATDHSGDPWRPDTDDMVRWLASKEWAPETKRSYRAALRSFYGWAHATGRIEGNPAALLPSIRPGQHGARPTPEHILTEGLAGAEDRVQVMILLAARCGLRRAEIAVAHSKDLVEDLAGCSLTVHGKGRKERLVPLSDDMATLLRSRGEGWLFPGQVDGHLSPRRVGELVRDALGVPGWTTHTLRHRFATKAYAGSRDLLAVQALLGHSTPATTQTYVRLPDDALRAAMGYAI